MADSKNPLADMPEAERTKRLTEDLGWVKEQGGRLPGPAYWLRLNTWPTVFHEYIEIAPSDDGTRYEVLMDFKPASDPFYANQWGTQGMTVMMRQMVDDLVAQHEKDESGISTMAQFRFCGVVTDSQSPRHHAYVNVFARVLHRKPSEFKGEWLPVDELYALPVIPLCRTYLDLVMGVLIKGDNPQFVEHVDAT